MSVNEKQIGGQHYKPYGSGAKPHYKMHHGRWVCVVCGFAFSTSLPKKKRLNDAAPQEWDAAAKGAKCLA